MIRLSKLTDYGFVILTQFALSGGGAWFTSRDLSTQTGLPLPTVSKLLKVCSNGGLLVAQRGVNGGYKLARAAETINVAEIIEIIDGPLAITDCACEGYAHNTCSIEDHCLTRPHWIRISNTIRAALANITLLDMATPPVAAITSVVTGKVACNGDQCSSTVGTPCGCGDSINHFLPSIDGADRTGR